MRMILAAAAMAAAVGAASVASATTFTGAYDVTGYWHNNNNNGGLNIDIFNGSGNFNITGLDFGESQTFTLFQIKAGEEINVPGSPNDADGTPKPIKVNFTFSQPVNFPGNGADATVSGITVGVDGIRGDYGQLTWTAPATVNFGSYGLLTISLQNVNFDDDNRTNVKATFALAAPGGGGGVGAVPEPATWGMMIMGFGLAGATLRRRRTTAVTA
jgi:PEP-CTERM motif